MPPVVLSTNSLSGGSLNDTLRGGAGNDRLNGGPGNDIISGGAGDDFIRTLNAGDQIDGGADRDTLDRLILSETSEPIALAFGSGTNLELSDGTRLSNVEVYNVIELGTGDDNVDAGFLNQGDSLSGGDGTDLLIVDFSGSSPDGRLPEGGVAFEILSGTGPEAVIDYGDGTRDEIEVIANFERVDATGSAFDDSLSGSSLDDTLAGGEGNDNLRGGLGYDTYVFGASWGADTITDRDVGGKLIFDGFAPGDITFTDVGSDRVFTDGTNTVTFVDYAGNNYQYDIEPTEAPPPSSTFTITPVDGIFAEDAGTVTFTITRSDFTNEETVFVSTVQDRGSLNENDYGGDQDRPGEFAGIEDDPLTFAAGDDQPKTVTLTVNDDAVVEPDETFRLIVQSSTDPDPDADLLASTDFTIEDNDTTSGGTVWAIDLANRVVGEDVGSLDYTVTRSNTDFEIDQTVFVSTVPDQGFPNNEDYGDPRSPGVFEGIEDLPCLSPRHWRWAVLQ